MLPSAHMYVGRTRMSLAEVREWNAVHAATEYELHRSDCRHFVNSLVHYTTGLERATASALRHQWAQNKERYGLAARVVRLGQYFTDVANWDQIRAISQATSAALMALAGQQVLAGLRAGQILRSMHVRLLPATRTLSLVPVRRALVQRHVYAVGTAAVATYAASGGQAPNAVRETLSMGARVAGGVQSAVRVAARLAEQVGRGASMTIQRTGNHAATLATGIAGAASRGAATVMKRGASSPSRAVVTFKKPSPAGDTLGGNPIRKSLPMFEGKCAQQLALVATSR